MAAKSAAINETSILGYMAMNEFQRVFVSGLVCVLGVCVASDRAAGDSIESVIAELDLDLPTQPGTYSFLVIGHGYGSPSGSGYPASSLLTNIENLRSVDAAFLLMLGDTIQHPDDSEIALFRSSFARKLAIPIFNAPGNHDVADRSFYAKHFGSTYFKFQYKSELFIILDTELNNGQIEGQQQEFLLQSLRAARGSPDIKNVFVLMHRLLYAIGNEPLSKVIPWVNGPASHPETATTFKENVLPELFQLSETKSVYLMGGDIGCKDYVPGKVLDAFPLLYHADPDRDITYLAHGMGENASDVALEVSVLHDGAVRFSVHALADWTPRPLDQYTLQHWEKTFRTAAEGSGDHASQGKGRGSLREFASRMKSRLMNKQLMKYFGAGMVCSLFLVASAFSCTSFWRRFRRR